MRMTCSLPRHRLEKSSSVLMPLNSPFQYWNAAPCPAPPRSQYRTHQGSMAMPTTGSSVPMVPMRFAFPLTRSISNHDDFVAPGLPVAI